MTESVVSAPQGIEKIFRPISPITDPKAGYPGFQAGRMEQIMQAEFRVYPVRCDLDERHEDELPLVRTGMRNRKQIGRAHV